MTVLNDDLEQIYTYVKDPSTAQKIIDFLKNCTQKIDEVKAQGVQKVFLTDECFVMTQSFEAAPIEFTVFESHKDFVDIQFIIEGQEIFGLQHVDKLEVKEEYSRPRDIMFYKTPEDFNEIKVIAGEYAIFYPRDAHMCRLQKDLPYVGLKAVVKVPVHLMNF